MPKETDEAAKKKEDIFFVGIRDPIELRRSILESSKEMIQYLQRNERFKNVRREKEEEIAKLKATVRDLRKLIRKLKTELPKTNLRASSKKRSEKKEQRKEAVEKRKKTIKKKEKAKTEAPVKQEPKAKLTDLEKLEAELGEIENRLTRVS